jgi:hypothetical protein
MTTYIYITNSNVDNVRLNNADPHQLLLGFELPPTSHDTSEGPTRSKHLQVAPRNAQPRIQNRTTELFAGDSKEVDSSQARRLSALHSRFQALADAAPPGQAPSRGSVSVARLSSDGIFSALLMDSERTFGYLDNMGARYVTFEQIRSHDQFVLFTQAHIPTTSKTTSAPGQHGLMDGADNHRSIARMKLGGSDNNALVCM